MIKFFLLLLACLIVGCSSKSRVRTDDCNYSCKSQKKLKQFCEDVELGGGELPRVFSFLHDSNK